MVEVQNLSAGYPGSEILRDVSVSFPSGKVLALLGPNGSGKSTLLKVVAGLHPESGGRVLIDGVPVGQMSPQKRAKTVAYLPQSRNIPNISVGRMVLHGRFPHLSYPRRYRPEDYAAARRALGQADAAELVDRLVPELSGGQRQKVYLAMALAQDAGMILMDEPTAYLDVGHQLEVMRLARGLAERGKTAVLVLHDLCLALRSADLVAALSDGRICASGAPEEVYRSGVLDRIFGIALRRVPTENGWQYYYG